MFIYFIKSQSDPAVFKIGRSKNPQERLKTHQTSSPYQLELVASFKCDTEEQCALIEQYFHRLLYRKHRLGEWFDDCKKIQDIVLFINQGTVSRTVKPVDKVILQLMNSAHASAVRGQHKKTIERVTRMLPNLPKKQVMPEWMKRRLNQPFPSRHNHSSQD